MAKTSNRSLHSIDGHSLETATSPDPWSLRDQRCIWHPFTQAQTATAPTAIVRGEGAWLYSEEGRGYLDAISSWWVNLHGHAHPYIAEKIAEQAAQLEQVIFADYTHPQAVRLAERILSLFGGLYSHLFYTDNGSTAIEVALKMALQTSHKSKILSFQNGYHGDTFGAMSAAGKNHFNRPFWPYLFSVTSLEAPYPGNEERAWKAFEKEIATGDVALFIYEPILQGSGGMRLYSGQILSQMIEACRQREIMTIGDEVLTGFGRTGPLFAHEHIETYPDILCLSKGITGGFLPLGATLVQPSIYNAFLSDDPTQALLHGHSYTANPLACAAANASLDLLLRPECGEQRFEIAEQHNRFKEKWGKHPRLKRCDVLGTLLILEFESSNASYHAAIKLQLKTLFAEHSIIVRPLGPILYLMPPYCIKPEELEHIYNTIRLALETL